MNRMVRRGHDVQVRLEMGARMLPDADSFNVVAEIPGSESPEEVVVMGGHFALLLISTLCTFAADLFGLTLARCLV